MIQIPTPTPISETQILQAVTRTVDTAFQQGVVGVLLLFAATGFITAIAVVIVVWSRRSVKPSDPTAGTNAAINALAEAISAGNKRLDETLFAQKEKDDEDRQQDKELNEKYIESISAQADATNSSLDALKKLITDSATMKEDLHTMSTQGSKPLNDLIVKFDDIQRDVKSIKETSANDHQSFEKILLDIAEMKEIVLRIDAKRSTGDIKRVEVVNENPLPVEVVEN